MAKLHTGACRETPCLQNHAYQCCVCSSEFTVNQENHLLTESYHTLATAFWPACSPGCYQQLPGLGYKENPNKLAYDKTSKSYLGELAS